MMKKFSQQAIYLEDICKNHSFFSFVKLTKKYNEFKGMESLASLILSIVFILVAILTLDYKEIDTIVKELIQITVPAYIGVIGFLFSGLALMSAIITLKTIKVIEADRKLKSIVGILFSFCFCGGIIIATMIFDALYYLYVYYCSIYYIFYGWVYCAFSFFVSYFTMYTLFYTVSLLNACIKLFFVNVYYENSCGYKN